MGRLTNHPSGKVGTGESLQVNNANLKDEENDNVRGLNLEPPQSEMKEIYCTGTKMTRRTKGRYRQSITELSLHPKDSSVIDCLYRPFVRS